MNNQKSFIVDFSKSQKSSGFNQILFCKCGNKQKSKVTIQRIVLKNQEHLFEDKQSIDTITCENCHEIYNFKNNLFGLMENEIYQLETEFERTTVENKHGFQDVLKKLNKYFYYDRVSNEIKEEVVIDLLTLDRKSSKITYFKHNSLQEKNQPLQEKSETLLETTDNVDYKSLIQNKIKNLPNTLTVFNLKNLNLEEEFFSFNDFFNYKNLEVCYTFLHDILHTTMDYDSLMSEKFLRDFKITSKIIEKNDNSGKKALYQNRINFFHSKELVLKRLNTGDYLYSLMQMSKIVSLFVTYPHLSSLYKTKGLNFLLKMFQKNYLCEDHRLDQHNVTSPNRILEICSFYFYKDAEQKEKSDPNKPLLPATLEASNFKLGSLLFKKLNDPDDLLVLYQFFAKKILNKTEIESLFLKYKYEDIILVMSKIISGNNMRNIILTNRHLNHILKNDLFKGEKDEWLNLYYDTINSLSLIVNVIKSLKNDDKNEKLINHLSRLSENKLFEIKNFKKLKEVHDELFSIYRALEDETKNELFVNITAKYKHLNAVENLFSFEVIPDLKELSHEGLIMKHCIYTYLNDVVDGSYLVFRVLDTISNEKATMGIKIEGNSLHLQQLKGYENSRGTSLLISTVLEFCEKNKIITKSSHLHSSDVTSNVGSEKRMKDYLPRKEAEKLRSEKMSQLKKSGKKLQNI